MAKGQVTIPKNVRTALGVESGDRVTLIVGDCATGKTSLAAEIGGYALAKLAMVQYITQEELLLAIRNQSPRWKTALGANNEKEIRRIETLLSEKQRELLALPDNDMKYDLIAEEILSLREEKQQVLVDDADRSMRIRKVDDLMEFVERQGTEIEEYDENLVRMEEMLRSVGVVE